MKLKIIGKKTFMIFIIFTLLLPSLPLSATTTSIEKQIAAYQNTSLSKIILTQLEELENEREWLKEKPKGSKVTNLELLNQLKQLLKEDKLIQVNRIKSESDHTILQLIEELVPRLTNSEDQTEWTMIALTFTYIGITDYEQLLSFETTPSKGQGLLNAANSKLNSAMKSFEKAKYEQAITKTVNAYSSVSSGLKKLNFTYDITADTDQDELKDIVELISGTNPLHKDTDGDGLPDGFEVIYYISSGILDPTKSDTDENGILDGDEDFDADQLTNIAEFHHNTSPEEHDTDGDNLSDYAEVTTHNTDPLVQDTDEDFLDDDSELELGTDPLNPDTDGDDILDGNEKRSQSLYEEELSVSLSIDATGDVQKTTTIKEDNDVRNFIGETGVIGKPIDIISYSEFETAQLTFSYDPKQLGDTIPENLAIFYFNPDTMQLEPVPNQSINVENNTVSATLEHFSTYVLGDMSLWAQSWQENLEVSPVPDDKTEERPLDLMLVIDSSGSMSTNDPDDIRKLGAIEVIRSLDLNDQAGIVTDRGGVVDFDNFARLLQGLTNDETALEDAINKIDSYGGTDIDDGVTTALNEIAENGRTDADKAIILLTDGVGSYYSYVTNRAINMNVKITTIGLGDNIDISLLQNIADQTGGDFYHAESAETLKDLLERSRDTLDNDDTDGDNIPDWVEKLAASNGGFILKGSFKIPFLNKSWDKHFKTDFNKADTDGDQLSDLEELGGLDNIYISADKTKVYLKDYPNSNPNLLDSDEDGDNDRIDDKPLVPYTEPVVMIHGIRQNSGDTWGADAWVDNGNLGLFPGQNEPDFTKDVPADLTATEKAYNKGDNLTYDHLDAQYIKEIRYSTLASYLEGAGYDRNKNLFVFNWENMDHTLYAAQHLRSYLQNLKNNYLPTMKNLDVTSGYSQEVTFSLVGHSAGGLVSRTYIEDILQDASGPRINKLITLDTPHTGSDYMNNGGICGTVLADLDREDSDLFYTNPSHWCSDYGAEKLDPNNKGTTDYILIGGLIGRYFEMVDDNVMDRTTPKKEEKYYISSSQSPILLKLTDSSKNRTDNDLYLDIKEMLRSYNINVPENNSGAHERPFYDINTPIVDVLSERYFGDNIVTLGSQLGIPADFQRENESGLNAIPFEQAYVLVGQSSQSSHGAIYNQQIIFNKIAEILR